MLESELLEKATPRDVAHYLALKNLERQEERRAKMRQKLQNM